MKACKWEKKAEKLVEWTRSKGMTEVMMRDVRKGEASDFLTYLRHEVIIREILAGGGVVKYKLFRRIKGKTIDAHVCEGITDCKIVKDFSHGSGEGYSIVLPGGEVVSASVDYSIYSYRVWLPESKERIA